MPTTSHPPALRISTPPSSRTVPPASPATVYVGDHHPHLFSHDLQNMVRPREKKPRNPASYFIWIYILIGSQAVRILQVKTDAATYSRRAHLQLEKLREVIRKLQAGEEVDVEKVLGTGVPEEEEAWEEAMKEIEKEERVWRDSKAVKREKRRQEKEKEANEIKEGEDASPVNTATSTSTSTSDRTTKAVEADKAPSPSDPPLKQPNFY